jgi:hypothetical protein
LQWRQHQQAVKGIDTSFEIVDDIRQIEEELAVLKQRIAQHIEDIIIRADRVEILSAEKQRAFVIALALIADIPINQIKLIEIVIGSIVLITSMPLIGAARLVAMQRLNHQSLRVQGIAYIAVDQVIDTKGKSLDALFDQAVSFEQAELESSVPPTQNARQPYANLEGTALVRIKLID